MSMSPQDSRRLSPLSIRPCRSDEIHTMGAIINAAAEAYRGVIPADRWHEPYMSESELRAEIDARVGFICCEIDGAMIAVMGMQTIRNVELIRHAYTLPGHQGRGVGSALIAHLRERTDRPVLVGTWAAATWAIRFYERHGFRLVPEQVKPLLLRAYWKIPERQIETSVVLAVPHLRPEDAMKLMEEA
jgi:GNAT superfamily N-acetyltransferase